MRPRYSEWNFLHAVHDSIFDGVLEPYFLAGAEGVEPSTTCFGDKPPSQRGSRPRYEEHRLTRELENACETVFFGGRQGNRTLEPVGQAFSKRGPRPCRTPSVGVERGNLTPVNRVAAGRLNPQPSRRA
jgi:hypothetical protein